MRSAERLGSWLLPVALAACSRPLTAPVSVTVPATTSTDSSPHYPYVTPSIIVPDVPIGTPALSTEPDGSRRLILAHMRILERPDGAIERAPDLLPSHSQLISQQLPTRLGGGFLFVASSESSAQIWRAPTWIAPLEAVASVPQAVSEAIPGFDRLYVRHGRGGPLYGIDLDSGQYTDFLPLPVPLRIGPALFADSWRAVATIDLRGPLATFDGGLSWFPLGIRTPIVKVTPNGDQIALASRDETFILSADGTLSGLGKGPPPVTKPYPTMVPRYPSAPQPSSSSSLAPPPQPIPHPVQFPKQRPLRLAVEHGFPIDSSRAVVADMGCVHLVDLKSGTLLKSLCDSYPKTYTECNAVQLGSGLGFVCGAQNGPTTVYRYAPPAQMLPVLQWPQPRAIFSAGNGAIVARAPCPGTPTLENLAQYCVLHVKGHTQDLRFKGDLGAERVVPLADGRVAVLVAPRAGAEGRIVTLQDGKATSRPIALQSLPRPVAEIARRGLWMQGAWETRPGVLGVWVESGGPLVGLAIDSSGHVTSGPVQNAAAGTSEVVVSGRFGLVWKTPGRGVESIDGGLTWNEFEIPPMPLPATPERRACSPVGCAVGGWMRVGWGPPASELDMVSPRRPPSRYLPNQDVHRKTLRCEPTGRLSPPLASSSTPQAKNAPPPPRIAAVPVPGSPPPRLVASRWIPFGPLPPPPLNPDEEGISSSMYSRPFGNPRTRFVAYAWGPRMTDWTRSGHWMLRIDDPYDTVGLPLSTAPAPAPWIDINTASASLNSSALTLRADPQIRSGAIGWCSGAKACKLFGVVPGEPPLPLPIDIAGTQALVSAIRTDESWFVLTQSDPQEMVLWTASLSGQVRKLQSFPRVRAGTDDMTMLVRRERSPGIALLTTSPAPNRGGSSGAEWIVLPLDPLTGRILDATRIANGDFDGALPAACADDQDGWLIESGLARGPTIDLPGHPFVSDIRARIRADPGRICTDALTGRVQRPAAPSVPRPPAATPVASNRLGVRLSVWDDSTSRKVAFLCDEI